MHSGAHDTEEETRETWEDDITDEPYSQFCGNCYDRYLKKCMKKLGPSGLEGDPSALERLRNQSRECATESAADDKQPLVKFEIMPDQSTEVYTVEDQQTPSIAEELGRLVGLVEERGKELEAEEEANSQGVNKVEEVQTPTRHEKEKPLGKKEGLPKDEFRRPSHIVPKSEGPLIPKEEQAFVPYTFYSQHSALTETEHSHYVAMSLQRASGGRFIHKEDKKKFSTIKEKLTEENEKFNEEVRQATITQHRNRYHTLPPAVRSYVQDIFLARTQSLCRVAPRSYMYKGKLCMDVNVSELNTPVLEFSKSLLVVGSAPSVQLPNLKRKASIPFRDVTPIVERYPANFHLEKKPISEDPNIPLLLEKYPADVVASASSLRALLSDFGPLYSVKYDIPVLVKSCKVEGALRRVVFLLKPQSSTKLSIPQLLSYVAKYALRTNLLVKPADDGESLQGATRSKFVIT